MLKDRFFYPLAIAIIAAIIWFAISGAEYEKLTPELIVKNGFTAEGENLNKLRASHGTYYKYYPKTAQDEAYVVLNSNIARKNASQSAGVFAPLGPVFEKTFAQQNLRITIKARQGKTDPLTHFDMGYFTADVGDSGWIRKSLTPQWHDFSIEFTPKTPNNKEGIDYFGVWPGEKGKNKTMEIQSMKIEVLPTLKN